MAKRIPAPPPTPRFFRHSKRPEWGIGRATDYYGGMLRVRFSDGQVRSFRGNLLEEVAQAEVPPALLEEAPVEPVRSVKSSSSKRKVGASKVSARKVSTRKS